MGTMIKITGYLADRCYRRNPPPSGHRHLFSRVYPKPDARFSPGVCEYRCPCGKRQVR